MKLFIYSIRDEKTGFLTPTVEQNNACAIRNFAHACRNSDSLFFTHPMDYSLYALAEYDTDNGRVEPLVQPMSIASATDFVHHEEIGGK